MRFHDLLLLSLSALWRQKLRTLLTLLGVTIGTATLTVSLAIGIGIQKVVEDQFKKEDRVRQIEVFPNYDAPDANPNDIPEEVTTIEGEMSEEKRERLKEASIKYWRRSASRRVPKPITKERLEAIAQLNHVVRVSPEINGIGRTSFENKSTDGYYYGTPKDHPKLKEILEVGETFSSDSAKEVLVHEFLLYRWGIHNENDLSNIFGKTVQLETGNFRRSGLSLLSLFGADASNLSQDELKILEKTWTLLPAAMEKLDLSAAEKALLKQALDRKRPGDKKENQARVSEEFKIVGVFRSPPKKSKRDESFLDGPWRDVELLIPIETGEKWMLQLPQLSQEGFMRARVIVDNEEHLKGVVDKIREMGFNEFSLGLFIEQIRTNTTLIGFGMNFIALIALVVAAIGITNTLFTSVLERTKEIGIMKAVGAKDRHVQGIFLIEGAIIGLLGGLLGLFLGWLCSLPGDEIAKSMIAKQPLLDDHPPESVFLYPYWVLIGVPMFALTVTTIAAWLPSRRAARVHPVIALRHE